MTAATAREDKHEVGRRRGSRRQRCGSSTCQPRTGRPANREPGPCGRVGAATLCPLLSQVGPEGSSTSRYSSVPVPLVAPRQSSSHLRVSSWRRSPAVRAGSKLAGRSGRRRCAPEPTAQSWRTRASRESSQQLPGLSQSRVVAMSADRFVVARPMYLRVQSAEELGR